MELQYSRSFVLHTSDGQTSEPHRLKNGVAQGSVLAPILYYIYISDFPAMLATRYMYADDEALRASAHTTSEIERSLSVDMQTVSEYLKKWRLKLSASKTVCSIFHQRNSMADHQLQVYLDKNHLRSEAKPTYQGVTLDRSLTFKVHLTKLKNKVSSSVTPIRRLAGTKWGASFGVLRASVLALAYSPAEYCAPAWTQSAHAHKIDVPLNEAMRLISGCLHSTPVSELPFLSRIPPPQECRDQICIKTHERARSIDHLLHEILHVKDAPFHLPS